MKYTPQFSLIVALVAGLFFAAEASPAYRAANYKEALARAKQTGEDIVVYQRGSDWSHLGELLLAEVLRWGPPVNKMKQPFFTIMTGG